MCSPLSSQLMLSVALARMATSEKHFASQILDDTPPSEKNVALLPVSGTIEDLEAIYGVNEKALFRKLDLKLLPALTLLCLLSLSIAAMMVSNDPLARPIC